MRSRSAVGSLERHRHRVCVPTVLVRCAVGGRAGDVGAAVSMLNCRWRVRCAPCSATTSLVELKVMTPVGGHVPAPLALICTLTVERYQPLSPEPAHDRVADAVGAGAGTTASAHATANAAASLTSGLARSVSASFPSPLPRRQRAARRRRGRASIRRAAARDRAEVRMKIHERRDHVDDRDARAAADDRPRAFARRRPGCHGAGATTPSAGLARTRLGARR